MHESLKNSIDENVFTNGYGLVTAHNLGLALKSMVTNLNKFMHFAGIATPATVPDTGDLNIFYIATEGGTYGNFSPGLTVQNGLTLLMRFNSTSWSRYSIAVDGADIGELVQRMNEIEDALAGLDLTDLAQTISDLEQWVANVGAPLNISVSEINTALSTLTGTVSTLSGNINVLDEDLSAAKNDIEILQSGVNGQGFVRYNTNGILEFYSPLDDENDLVRRYNVGLVSTMEQNGVIMPVDVSRVPKGERDLNNSILLKNIDNDLPFIYSGQTLLGGKNTFYWPILLTKAAHGKTYADIGSVYKTATNVTYVIAKIVNSDSLILLKRFRSSPGYYSFSLPATSGLTHVTGGVNTDTLTGYTVARLIDSGFNGVGIYGFVATSVRHISILSDKEKTIQAGEESQAKTVFLREKYHYKDLPAVASYLIENKPAGGYVSNPDISLMEIEPVFTIENVYSLQDNGVTLLDQKVEYNKPNDFIAVLAPFVEGGGVGDFESNIFIPHSKQFTSGSVTLDFSNFENSVPLSQLSTQAYATARAFLRDQKAGAVRFVYKPVGVNYDLSTGVVLGFGAYDRYNEDVYNKFPYSAIFAQGVRKSPVTLYVEGRNQNFPAGFKHRYLSFWDWKKRDVTPGMINKTGFEYGNKYYLMLDYSGNFSEKIAIPAEYIGGTFEVLGVDNNLTIEIDAPGFININCTNSANSGSVEIVFNKTKSEKQKDNSPYSDWVINESFVGYISGVGAPVINLRGRGNRVISKEFHPVETRKMYQFSFQIKKNASLSGDLAFAYGFMIYDKDFNPINVADPAQTSGRVIEELNSIIGVTGSANNSVVFQNGEKMLKISESSDIISTGQSIMVPSNTAYVKPFIQLLGTNVPAVPTGTISGELMGIKFRERHTGEAMPYAAANNFGEANLLYGQIVLSATNDQFGIKIGSSLKWFSPVS